MKPEDFRSPVSVLSDASLLDSVPFKYSTQSAKESAQPRNRLGDHC